MLSAYRILDLSDEQGLLCGQILADLGADVIQVEPPGGSTARRQGPFAGDIRDPERSLFWWAYTRNKRSLVLDLEAPGGRDELRALARTADFLIESGAPGDLARRGLGYEDLAAQNPGLVYVSITPFGQDGPKADRPATDLTLWAAAGPLILTGDEDRAPVRITGVPQAFLHASMDGALAALVALFERLRSGRGQHVDISAQQSCTAATQCGILASAIGDAPFQRIAGGTRNGPLRLQLVFPASDGHVAITHVFGSAIGPATRRLMEYVYDNGFCDAATRDKDWDAYGGLLLSGREPFEEFERVKGVIASCTASRTKAELFKAGLDRGLLIAPVCTLREVVESQQLAVREYFQKLDSDEGRSVVYPGPFAKLGAAPIRYRRRPPRIAEHRDELRAEARPSRPEPSSAPRATDAELPLAGVKILDFMWALAGPGATRALADWGATVVRLESTTKVDVCRTLHPYVGGVTEPELSAMFHSTNAGKLMITLDPRKPEGREVVLDLVRWADVVTESFSPKGMRGFGLGYETLREVKPDLIMLSTCLMGQTGPLAGFAGFGNLAAALAGYHELTGWPDRAPAGPFSAYTDYIAPRYNAIAVLAALEHRRRTGQGQHIDLAQEEAALHLLAPAILDYTVNGRVLSRQGNVDPEMAPHGVYPCAGEDRWVAIAVRDDPDWRALCRAMEQPGLARDARFASADKRLGQRAELDRVLARFTEKLAMEEVEAKLLAVGVPVHAVQNGLELARDAQLLHRGHFIELPLPGGSRTVVESARFRMSRSTASVPQVAPTFGCDNEHVLKKILGYDDDRVAQIVIAGALE